MKINLIKTLRDSILFDHRYYKGFSSANRTIQVIHYIKYGYKKLLNPHPLFNVAYYLSQNEDVRTRNIEPMNHYSRHGRWEGRNPHPIFDTNFYLKRNKDVVIDGVNPLVHFITHGFHEHRSPSAEVDLDLYREIYPDIIDTTSDIERLVHWYETEKKRQAELYISMRRRVYTPPVFYSKSKCVNEIGTITIQCVYGPQHISHIQNILIPSLSRSTKRNINFYCLAYKPNAPKIVSTLADSRISIWNIENKETNYGFSAAHNRIFSEADPQEVFVLVNPDCVIQDGAIDTLINRYLSADEEIGIVEGRQWPFEHPKEYDVVTLETPWASGAFCLINSNMYKKVGGMDDIYFLYLEDVDLSWQSWLAGYPVIYEKNAVAFHFSGGRFYREDLVESEKYYSLRNFIIISKKFLGDKGEENAIALLRRFPDKALVEQAIADYTLNFSTKVTAIYDNVYHPKIKIYGVCQFHKMRQL